MSAESVLAEGHVEQGGNGCVSLFWAAGVFQRIGRWAQWNDGVPDLADVVVFTGVWIALIIALSHISDICPVEIEDVSEVIDGTMSELLEVEGVHFFCSDGCERSCQSDRFFCVSRREIRRFC